ncbi:Uncharacterised protein [Pantoea agglomerans]|uniref:Uncharacterized protein n=1 Tax=Enterobacter agglomerans TaxID=549 RepID=A0A379AH62_ENTAG|nr:Uncharacterised protein [Pantoea agglomerans]
MITNRVRQGLTLLGMVLLITQLSGCDKGVAQNAAPPAA